MNRRAEYAACPVQSQPHGAEYDEYQNAGGFVCATELFCDGIWAEFGS